MRSRRDKRAEKLCKKLGMKEKNRNHYEGASIITGLPARSFFFQLHCNVPLSLRSASHNSYSCCIISLGSYLYWVNVFFQTLVVHVHHGHVGTTSWECQTDSRSCFYSSFVFIITIQRTSKTVSKANVNSSIVFIITLQRTSTTLSDTPG